MNITVLLDYSKYKDKSYESDSPQVSTYCGRLVGIGGMRAALRKYDIKKRLYIGPTTLDHALAFIMANLVGVQRGNICLDPFVGTASLLVALAHHGAFCFGSDIDVRVIRGMMYAGQHRVQDSDKAKDAANEREGGVPRDVFSTFRDYGCRPHNLCARICIVTTSIFTLARMACSTASLLTRLMASEQVGESQENPLL